MPAEDRWGVFFKIEIHGDGWLPGVVQAGNLVELPDTLSTVEGVRLGAGFLVGGGGEHPPEMVVSLLGPLKDGLHGLRFRTRNPNQSMVEQAKQKIRSHALAGLLGTWDYRDADDVVQALELEEGEAPGRPGARVGDIEVVPPRHGGEPGGGVAGHGAPEGGRRPVEGAGIGDLVQRRPRHLTRGKETEHMDPKVQSQ